MSIEEKIVQKLQNLDHTILLKVLEYLEFLEYQKLKEEDPGLKTAVERSNLFDQGKTKPLTKEEFWDELKRKLG